MSSGGPFEFSAEQRTALLAIARSSLKAHLLEGEPDLERATDASLRERRAAFVTLTRRGDLRGCVGLSEAVLPLEEVVRQCAVAAATEDYRFSPVRREELEEITLSISVLSPLTPMTSLEHIEVGRHGLLLRNGDRRGLLLPQVAAERGWDRFTFLEETSRKAGLVPEAWRSEGTTVYLFEAEVFSE